MTHYLLGLEGAFGKLSCLAVPFLIPLTRNPSYSAFAPSLRNSWTTWVLLQSSTAMHQRIIPTMDMFPLMVVDVLNCARKYWFLVTQIWNYIHIIIIITTMIINLRSVFSTKFDGPFSPRFGMPRSPSQHRRRAPPTPRRKPVTTPQSTSDANFTRLARENSKSFSQVSATDTFRGTIDWQHSQVDASKKNGVHYGIWDFFPMIQSMCICPFSPAAKEPSHLALPTCPR